MKKLTREIARCCVSAFLVFGMLILTGGIESSPSVSGALTNIDSICGSGGACLDLTGASPSWNSSVTFAGGTSLSTGQKHAFANGSTISGDSGANTIHTAGSGRGIDFKENANEGGSLRLQIENTGSGGLYFRNASGTLRLVVTTNGVQGNATTEEVIFPNGIRSDAPIDVKHIAVAPTAPSDGYFRLFATSLNNVMGLIDQASTSAAITTTGTFDVLSTD